MLEFIQSKICKKKEKRRKEHGHKYKAQCLQGVETHEENNYVANKRDSMKTNSEIGKGYRVVRRLHTILEDTCNYGGGGQDRDEEGYRLG